jgi:hypothetical protein
MIRGLRQRGLRLRLSGAIISNVSGDLQAQRIRSLYRRLVLLGRAKLPLEAGRRLVGPDCAYHLYFRHASPPGPSRRRRRQARG